MLRTTLTASITPDGPPSDDRRPTAADPWVVIHKSDCLGYTTSGHGLAFVGFCSAVCRSTGCGSTSDTHRLPGIWCKNLGADTSRRRARGESSTHVVVAWKKNAEWGCTVTVGSAVITRCVGAVGRSSRFSASRDQAVAAPRGHLVAPLRLPRCLRKSGVQTR